MENHQILKELNACATLCSICYSACLREEDVKMLSRCIRLDLECAEICQLSASFFARESGNTVKLLTLCADICLQCAEECEKHAHEHCKKCAIVCRTCHEMCKEYCEDMKQVSSAW
jgi:hypothetical protein